MKQSGRARGFTPFAITVAVLFGAAGIALWLAYGPWQWERVKEDFRNRHPAIGRIDCEGLHEWFAKPHGPKPVVIDVRPQADFDFSHIESARHMALTDTPSALGVPEKTNDTLVIYDGVGENSFSVAASLLQRGYPRVQVLEGGIFEWANRGLPLAGSAAASGTVRPGNSKFANLLSRHATAP